MPSSAFSPPNGYGEGTSGLKAEFFGDTKFEQVKTDRLDSSLQTVWTWGPVAPVYNDQCQQILNHGASQLLSSSLYSQLPADSRTEFMSSGINALLGRMSLSQRAQVIRALAQRPEMLAATSDNIMSALIQTVYMLPGDEHLDLLVAWSKLRPQPRCHPGELRGHGNAYFTDNWEYYWHIGTFLQGPHFNDVQKLWSEHLELENGECNLRIVYATVFAAQEDSVAHGKPRGMTLRKLLDAKLKDEAITGDVRVTWLIARSFVEETLGSHAPRLLKGKQYLEEASLIASSNDYKFWALQELASRYASLGQAEKLESLLSSRSASFSKPDQQEFLNQCRTKSVELAKTYGVQQIAARESANADHVAELERRLKKAQAAGGTGLAARLQKLIQNAKGR